ncbi:hypothetical protein [Blastomonas fulva]
MTNEQARAFFADLDEWLAKTGTHFKCLAAAAGTTTNAKGSVIRHSCSMRIAVADKLIAAKNANPNGIAPPPKKASTGRPIAPVADYRNDDPVSDCELQRRRDEVRREREQRAIRHLSAEKPGLNGKRAFSMRPVWEMPA